MIPGSDPRQKTGYQLRRSVVLAVRDAVREGAAESQNAFVASMRMAETPDGGTSAVESGPFEVTLERGSAGNSEDSIAMPQQIWTVSKTDSAGGWAG